MSIGSALTSAREAAGLSLEDVAARTRIRRTLILGMENDDFSACGGDFYARGHLRTVAATLGLDPTPLLAEFDAARPESPSPRATDVFESETNARPERRGPNWTAAMAVALALLVGYAGVQAFTGSTSRPADRIAGTRPDPATSAPTATPTPTSAPTDTGGGAVAQVPRGKVTVAVLARETSWVQVTTDTGQELFQGILADGQRKTFTDKTLLKLVIGNAGGVDLTVNGADIGAPGKRGQVARVRFTPADPAAG